MPNLDLDQTLETASLTWTEVVLAVVILVLAGLVARWVRRGLRSYLQAQENLQAHLPNLLARLAGWGVMLVGVLVALAVLGVDMAPVVLLLLLVGGVLAFSGKGLLENFAAGLMLQIRGPFRIGDRVDVKGFTGTVKEINARAVVVVTGDHRYVHVPNSDVLNDPIVNYTSSPERRSDVGVGIAYEADVVRAKQLIVEAASTADGVYADPNPMAYIDEFGDSSVDIVVRFWHDDGERVAVRDNVAEAVKRALDTAGIDIPFPQSVVELHRDAAPLERG
jgi:small-conductance mechanosensitive channel